MQKLSLNKETLRTLNPQSSGLVAGGTVVSGIRCVVELTVDQGICVDCTDFPGCLIGGESVKNPCIPGSEYMTCRNCDLM